MKRNPPRKWTPVQVRVNPKGQVQLKISPTTLQNNPSVREALTRLGAENLEGVTSGGKMTLAGAKARLRRIAEAQGGTLTKSGEFVDLPRDPHVVGYGATPVGNGRYIIVSVPRGERNPAKFGPPRQITKWRGTSVPGRFIYDAGGSEYLITALHPLLRGTTKKKFEVHVDGRFLGAATSISGATYLAQKHYNENSYGD